MIYALTAVSLAYMMALMCITAIRLCAKDRARALASLKNFRRGSFALIFVAAAPLYWLGHYYNGSGVGEALLRAVRSCIELVVLKFDVDGVFPLMCDNAFFAVTMSICFVLVLLNAVLLSFALFGQRLNNAYLRRKAFNARKVYLVVGNDEQNKSIVNSVSSGEGKVLFVTDAPDAADFAFIYRKPVLPLADHNLTVLLLKYFKRFDDKTVNVIINTGDTAANLLYLEQVCTIIEQQQLDKLATDETRGLSCYVLGDAEAESAYCRLEEQAKGCIHYINKYKLIAMDFIDRYPLTHFMNGKQIDFSTATLQNDVDVNVLMLGFGKLGRQLFLTSVANHQFLTHKEGKLCEKPVNYYIYDKLNSKNDKNLNHNYFRYRNECLNVGNPAQYLPLPPMPAKEHFYELDVNEEEFYHSLRFNLAGNGNSFNYVIISFGNDVQNLDFAEKLCGKLKEWELNNCTKVFVKIRSGALTARVAQRFYCGDGLLYTFGNEEEMVYNLRQIVAEKQEVMAKDRHFCYKLNSTTAKEEEQAVKAAALRQWFSWHQVQRQSNVYACLSIRMKLNLLGYDYTDVSSPLADASLQFISHYTTGDPIVYDDSKGVVKGKLSVKYSNNFVEGSVRQTLAIQEHQRWNAYMITSGIIPSSLAQLREEGSKNLALRRHSNITTFEGLVLYRQLAAKMYNCSEEDADVIRYDYQLMDDVVWLLAKNGYKIIKREL